MPKFNYEVIECTRNIIVAGFVTKDGADHLRNVLHNQYTGRRYAVRPVK